MKFGYARVSTGKQSVDRQTELLEKEGCDEIIVEAMSGTLASRPELDRLLGKVRKGDVVVVESFSRLARSTKNLLELVEFFNKTGINLVSLKERFDTQTANGRMMLGIIATLSQFERDLIAERTKEGLAVARARGRKGGRKPTEKSKIDKAKKLYDTKQFTVEDIIRMVGISRGTFYRHLNDIQSSKIGALNK